MLPPVPDASALVSTTLELALEKVLGTPASSQRVSRILRILKDLTNQAVMNGDEPPRAVVFSKDDSIPRRPISGNGRLCWVKDNDSVVVEQHPYTLASLDEYAATLSRNIDSVLAVYTRTMAGQHFYINGRGFILAQLGDPSIFVQGTHYDLEEVLDSYHDVVQNSNCGYLKQCWRDPEKRLLDARPAERMRDSLGTYLSYQLRNHIVERRTNVAGMHDADVSVHWKSVPRRAFIAIDWLGTSTDDTRTDVRVVKDDASMFKRKCVDPYRAAHQGIELIGYFTVFDAREDRSEGVPVNDDVAEDPLVRTAHTWNFNPPRD